MSTSNAENETADQINAEENEGAPVADAQDPLAAAQAEAAKWKDLAARNQAELDNYRKRVARDREDDGKRVRAGLLEQLLPVLDNF